jgi:hypothetical protein
VKKLLFKFCCFVRDHSYLLDNVVCLVSLFVQVRVFFLFVSVLDFSTAETAVRSLYSFFVFFFLIGLLNLFSFLFYYGFVSFFCCFVFFVLWFCCNYFGLFFLEVL